MCRVIPWTLALVTDLYSSPVVPGHPIQGKSGIRHEQKYPIQSHPIAFSQTTVASFVLEDFTFGNGVGGLTLRMAKQRGTGLVNMSFCRHPFNYNQSDNSQSTFIRRFLGV
jgi:hypothetical protein